MFPKLEIYPDKIKNNAEILRNLCHEHNIRLAGVTKGANNIPEVIRAVIAAGVDYIADSRINRFEEIRKIDFNIPLMLLRIPAFQEVKEVIKYADISLNSEIKIIKALNNEAKKQNKKHKIVLMIELGDLREGIYPAEKVIDKAIEVDNLSNIILEGIGSNLSCYGGIKPDENNLGKLAKLAKEIEDVLERKLNIISGGSTTSLPLVISDKIPKKINNLRIGESILLGRDMKDLWGYNIKGIKKDTFILKAEVIELKTKASKPYGETFVDAFGHKPSFEDKGNRKRAILNVGKADFVYADQLIPKEEGIEILGASSDHLILDVEEAKKDIKLGDILSFELFYGPMLYLTASQLVEKVIIK
ncbi:MAG: alanine/ornithine racemase family PLP-dependent enzyme [Bacillota bacterium]